MVNDINTDLNTGTNTGLDTGSGANSNTVTTVTIHNSGGGYADGFYVRGEYLTNNSPDWKKSGSGVTDINGKCTIYWFQNMVATTGTSVTSYRISVYKHECDINEFIYGTTNGNWLSTGAPQTGTIDVSRPYYTHNLICHANRYNQYEFNDQSDGYFGYDKDNKIKLEAEKSKSKKHKFLISSLEKPKHDKKFFDYWCNKSGDRIFGDIETVCVGENTTAEADVYSSWYYKLSFVPGDGGSCVETERKVEIIDTSSIVKVSDLPTAYKPGYTFKGWKNGEVLIDDSEFYISENTTLIAEYDQIPLVSNSFEIKVNDKIHTCWLMKDVEGTNEKIISVECKKGDKIEFIPKRGDKSYSKITGVVSDGIYRGNDHFNNVFDFNSINDDFNVTVSKITDSGDEIINMTYGEYNISNIAASYKISFGDNIDISNINYTINNSNNIDITLERNVNNGFFKLNTNTITNSATFSINFNSDGYKPIELYFKIEVNGDFYSIKVYDIKVNNMGIESIGYSPIITLYGGVSSEIKLKPTQKPNSIIFYKKINVEFYKNNNTFNGKNVNIEFTKGEFFIEHSDDVVAVGSNYNTTIIHDNITIKENNSGGYPIIFKFNDNVSATLILKYDMLKPTDTYP